MKKVLVAGAALMLAGVAAPVFAADATPGVVFDGDARVRLFYKSDGYTDKFRQTIGDYGSQANMDSRVRLNMTGTAAGGAYAKARIRIYESYMGNMDTDLYGIGNVKQSNIWADQAYVGVPFTKEITVEAGKYRSTYGPLGTTYNFFYDDVQATGARGIIKIGSDIVVNPFVEWLNEAQNTDAASGYANNSTAQNQTIDINKDNDEYRIGAHVKAKLNKDWTVGGMLGYQVDNRIENPTYTATVATTTAVPVYQTNASGQYLDASGNVTNVAANRVQTGTANVPSTTTQTVTQKVTSNTGLFGSVYVNGKAGDIGLVGELAYTAAKLNGFNMWAEDSNTLYLSSSSAAQTGIFDSIGSKNDGYGGYIFPNYQIDKLNLGLSLGFTANGFRPDLCYGFVMLGGKDNSVIGDAIRIGDTGDWFWAGFVPSYKISDDLKLTANFVYASINSDANLQSAANVALMKQGIGPVPYTTTEPLSSAYEISAVLQYTISKGADVFFSAGYMKPSFNNNGSIASSSTLKAYSDEGLWGAATRFELKF